MTMTLSNVTVQFVFRTKYEPVVVSNTKPSMEPVIVSNDDYEQRTSSTPKSADHEELVIISTVQPASSIQHDLLSQSTSNHHLSMKKQQKIQLAPTRVLFPQFNFNDRMQPTKGVRVTSSSGYLEQKRKIKEFNEFMMSDTLPDLE